MISLTVSPEAMKAEYRRAATALDSLAKCAAHLKEHMTETTNTTNTPAPKSMYDVISTWDDDARKPYQCMLPMLGENLNADTYMHTADGQPDGPLEHCRFDVRSKVATADDCRYAAKLMTTLANALNKLARVYESDTARGTPTPHTFSGLINADMMDRITGTNA